MQSAGGMTMSPADMGAWLQMNLRGEGPAGSGLTADIVSEAQTIGADVDREARNAYELPCYGYALGWAVCDFEGHEVYFHGGGYTGARTMMAFSPELGVGIGVFSNSDNQTGWLTSRTAIMFLQFVIDHEDAERWVELRQERYPGRIERLMTIREERVAEARGEDVFQDWSWQPAETDLAAFEGLYESEAVYAPIRVETTTKGLIGSWGDWRFTLEPAAQDVFAAALHPLDAPTPVKFERAIDGSVSAVVWDGQRAEKR